MRFHQRVKKFLIAGLSAAFVNLSLMILLVEYLGFKTYLLKNLANIMAIEVSIIYNFMVSRAWTWRDVPPKKGKDLMAQCVSFHAANLVGMAARVIIFATLERLGVFYVLNVILGIGVAAAMSFVLYDRIVFKKPMDEKPSL
jgi:dolichol-phosphate mannosyltransferase